MYTGITQGVFEVVAVEHQQDLLAYQVQLSAPLLQHLHVGASVSIDGVCQTVVAIEDDRVTFHAIANTLNLTTLKKVLEGSRVSVERSLRYGDEIGGHEMAGHVVGTARVVAMDRHEHSLSLVLRCPEAWLKYILPKGFIGVDGSSLTVAEVDEAESTFTIHLIPETLRLTHFADKDLGDEVNIELDHKTQAIVTTVERLLAHGGHLKA